MAKIINLPLEVVEIDVAEIARRAAVRALKARGLYGQGDESDIWFLATCLEYASASARLEADKLRLSAIRPRKEAETHEENQMAHEEDERVHLGEGA